MGGVEIFGRGIASCDRSILDHHYNNAKNALEDFLRIWPPSLLPPNEDTQSLAQLPVPQAHNGTILIPLWEKTDEFREMSKNWFAKKRAAFRAFMTALNPILIHQSHLFKQHFPMEYGHARKHYLYQKQQREEKGRMNTEHVLLPEDNCFASVQISANVSAPFQTLDSGRGGNGVWTVMVGLGNFTANVFVPDVKKTFVLEEGAALCIAPTAEARMDLQCETYYLLELHLPHMMDFKTGW